MSENFLFFFAALGALGGLATFGDVALRVSDRLLGRGKRKMINPTEADADNPLLPPAAEQKRFDLQISPTRYAIVMLLLTVSVTLSTSDSYLVSAEKTHSSPHLDQKI